MGLLLSVNSASSITLTLTPSHLGSNSNAINQLALDIEVQLMMPYAQAELYKTIGTSINVFVILF